MRKAMVKMLCFLSLCGLVACASPTGSTGSTKPAETPQAAAPTFSIGSTSGTFEVSSATTGSTIYYTVDSTAPTINSLTGSSPVTVTPVVPQTTTIKAYASKTGYTDSVVTTYNVPFVAIAAVVVTTPLPINTTNSLAVTATVLTNGGIAAPPLTPDLSSLGDATVSSLLLTTSDTVL